MKVSAVERVEDLVGQTLGSDGHRGEIQERIVAVKDGVSSTVTAKTITKRSYTMKAPNIEVIIQGRNGQIRSKDSYGNDPCPPRDKEH